MLCYIIVYNVISYYDQEDERAVAVALLPLLDALVGEDGVKGLAAV